MSLKIAIIGSSGYIGSYLVHTLEDILGDDALIDGYDIVPSPTTNFVKKGCDVDPSEYDVVIYLAGLSGRASCNNTIWGNIYKENVEDVCNLAMQMNNDQLFIYASTAGILEGSGNQAVDEHYITNKELLDSYTQSMLLREEKLQNLAVRTVGLRFGTVIGISPRQRKDLVHIAMMRAAYIHGYVDIYNPNCNRAILWLRDLGDAFIQILKAKDIIDGHRVYNIASFNTTILEIAKKVTAATHTHTVIRGDDLRVKGFSIDTRRFQTDFHTEFHGNQDIIINELKENIGHLCMDGENMNICLEDKCRVCKSKNHLMEIIDLGMQPLANNFVKTVTQQDTYPLCLLRCRKCHHTQLNFTVKPEVMFRNYQYVSGTSFTLCRYFRELAEVITEKNGKPGIVLELACNDGSQLDEFKKLGWDTYGVDPAKNVVQSAIERGHKIHCGFWGVDSVPFPTPNVILAQNVLAHVPDPIVFLKACNDFMGDNTVLYIQTSQCNMYVNGEFDTIYHEHLSFFTIKSMMYAAEVCGLRILSIYKQPIHGMSYLFEMKKAVDTKEHGEKALIMMQDEDDIGLYEDDFYTDIYTKRIMDIKEWVMKTIDECLEAGLTMLAYGAAAKGMTMLNYFGIKCLSYIVDDAPLKHFKYTPGTNTIVYPVNMLSEDNDEDICIIVLAWNFLGEITEKVKELRKQATEKGRRTVIMQVFPIQRLFDIN